MNNITKLTTLFIFLLAILAFSNIYIKVQAHEYTVKEVAKHNTPEDCWMIFENKVYDISGARLKIHDRYMDIRPWCGKDMTKDFKDKAGMGVDHKPSSYKLLEEYYIGDLSGASISPTEQEIKAEEEENYSVEISGSEMKNKTIKEIAELWGISAETYLAALKKEFNLTGAYTIDSKLDDLRVEYKFSPSLAKDVAEKIKSSPGDNNQAQESSSSVSKDNVVKPRYNIIIPLLISIVLYSVTYWVSGSKLGKKYKVLSRPVFNFFWNTVLLLSLIPAFGFGILMVLRHQFTELYNWSFDYEYWHVEIGVVMGTIAILHFIQRFRQYVLPLRLFKKR